MVFEGALIDRQECLSYFRAGWWSSRDRWGGSWAREVASRTGDCADHYSSCGATGLLGQGGDEEGGAGGGVFVSGAVAEELAGGGGRALGFEGFEVVVEGLCLEGSEGT